jgi:hypothetical protein
MSKIFKNAITSAVKRVEGMCMRAKAAVLMVCVALLKPAGIFAQSLANTGYEAGTNAMEEVATQIAAYVPYVVNLCYALAGVVAVVGAISVYIAMNNEEQDVKNILVLQNRQETRRKEMKLNSLLHNTLCRYLNFPIFENVVLKNI